jgi:predicted metal-dependent HD superfamily phosphohydrolase
MENILDYVKEKWTQLTSFSKKEEVKEQLWKEIINCYSGQNRQYHNLSRVAYLYTLLDEYIDEIINPAVIGFAILYHNVVYDAYSLHNEDQSAAVADAHLRQLNVNQGIINNTKTFIKATKDHIIPAGFSLQTDLSFFLDFDMAILGVDDEVYKLYSKKIRQEYSIYRDPLYKEGRKLALQRVLALKNIFTTTEFREVMELKARQNINRELSLL